jgi:hypothetical protein
VTPLQELLRRKCELLGRGLRVAEATWQWLAASDALLPRRMRSGTAGGLHLMLAPGVTVDCPVSEPFVAASPLALEPDGHGFHVVGPGGAWPVVPVARPRWHDRYGPEEPLPGQVCGDRLTLSLSNHCALFQARALRCTFCSIGFNRRRERSAEDHADLLRAIALAWTDPAHPVRHLMIGGGTPDLVDRGYRAAGALARLIKTACPDLPLSAMVLPPTDTDDLARLRDAGVQEIAINLEIWSPAASAAHIPGKHRLIGRNGYLRALEGAVAVFGARRVRSLVVAGLEPLPETLAAVEALASIGVVPVLSPLRPLQQTALADHAPPAPQWLFDLHEAALAICHRHGTCLGPLCAGCQGNTLSVHGYSDVGPTPGDG